MAYLSDTARLVLEAAAQRDDLTILPFPETVKAKGGAMQKVLTGLRNRGFVRAVQGDPQRVVSTSEGMAAVGAEADESPAEPETGPTAADAGDPDEAPAPAAEADTAAEPANGGAAGHGVGPCAFATEFARRSARPWRLRGA